MTPNKYYRALLFMTACVPFCASGCLGAGDIFSETHHISGRYELAEGDAANPEEIWLFEKGSMTSLAGPLGSIGWNAQYVVFTERDAPVRWQVLDVSTGMRSVLSEEQRLRDPRLRSIAPLTPKTAWTKTPGKWGAIW